MKWINRETVKVDRVACARLIRKFVDPQTKVVFRTSGSLRIFLAFETTCADEVVDYLSGYLAQWWL